MSAAVLPAELWLRIFAWASDEDVLLGYGFPPVLAESAWFKGVSGEWNLRTPEEALNALQRRNYATKKAIIATCRLWGRIASERLFSSLFFSDPCKLSALRDALDASKEGEAANGQLLSRAEGKMKEGDDHTIRISDGKGWWTGRIHIARYPSPPIQPASSPLPGLLSHTPNLRILINEWSSSSDDIGRIFTALTIHCRSLHTLSLVLPALSIGKSIWALKSLPCLVSLHLTFEPPPPEAEEDLEHMGASSGIELTHPFLSQLSLAGYTSSFIEQAAAWILPALRSVSINTGVSLDAMPDMKLFLGTHGPQLTMLNLCTKPAMDVPGILDMCPSLRVFAFNADWRFETRGSTSTGAADDDPSAAATLVNRPHNKITHIGLHGLLYAFHVGLSQAYATSSRPLEALLSRRANDRTFRALTRENFPQLKCVRVLNRTVLNDLHRADGPSDGEGMERWERWWESIGAKGTALEDCTGNSLGVLPNTEDSDSETDDDSDGYEEGNSTMDGEWVSTLPENSTNGIGELRALLEECRVMSETREVGVYTQADSDSETTLESEDEVAALVNPVAHGGDQDEADSH